MFVRNHSYPTVIYYVSIHCVGCYMKRVVATPNTLVFEMRGTTQYSMHEFNRIGGTPPSQCFMYAAFLRRFSTVNHLMKKNRAVFIVGTTGNVCSLCFMKRSRKDKAFHSTGTSVQRGNHQCRRDADVPRLEHCDSKSDLTSVRVSVGNGARARRRSPSSPR